MGDSLPWTPMNRHPKFDAEKSVTLQTHTHNYKQTVTDISTPCLSAWVDNKENIELSSPGGARYLSPTKLGMVIVHGAKAHILTLSVFLKE